jgi:hypothetical protein
MKLREKIKHLNLILAYLFIPFIPIMISFYRIEPEFVCNPELSGILKKCEFEEICSNTGNLNYHNDFSYYSFKYSYYDLHKRVACKEFFALNYFYLFYYLGILFGKVLVDFAKFHTILRHCLLIVSLSLHCFILGIYIVEGVNFDILFPIFIINSGMCFYILSYLLYSVINEKWKDFNYIINIAYCLCAIFHISMFYFTKTWVNNAYCFIAITVLCLFLYLVTYITPSSQEDGSVLLTKRCIKLNNEEKLRSLLFPSHKQLHINLHKIADRKFIYFQLLLIFLTSLTTHSINGFVDVYSYTKYESTGYLFINGMVIYVSELLGIAYTYMRGRQFVQRPVYNVYGISAVGVSLTFCIIGRKVPLVQTIALCLAKFIGTVFNGYLILTLSGHYIEKVKNMSYISYLTILSGIVSPFVMRLENNFLVLSVFYYICFLLNIKLIH